MLPRTMRGAILSELRKPLVFDEVELPDRLDVGQVLVKVHYSGICGSQLGEIDGVKGNDKFLPHLLGHEGSATVVGVGPGVRFVKEGDSVVLHWRRGAGIDAAPPVYRWRGGKLNAGWVTTLSEYAIVSENRITPVSHGSDLAVAALFGCAVTTGFGVVENNAKVRMGESVVVFGAGGVGLNIIQAAALVSAHPVIAVDQFDAKLELARKMGATHTINSRRVDVVEAIRQITPGQEVDVFIDNTGNPRVIELGYELTSARGRVTLVGVPGKGENISIDSLPLHFGKMISGSHGGESIPQEDIPRYMRLLNARGIRLSELITAVYSLEEVNGAIDDMRAGRIAGRCLIKFPGS